MCRRERRRIRLVPGGSSSDAMTLFVTMVQAKIPFVKYFANASQLTT